MAQNATNNVLIFGGSTGIGLAVAKLAVVHLPNTTIILSSSNKTKLAKAAGEIKELHPASSILEGIECDLSNLSTQSENIERTLQTAVERFQGKIDHIVWTAGNPPPMEKFGKNPIDDLTFLSTVRLYGPIALAKLVPAYMKESRHSSLTITSAAVVPHRTKGAAHLVVMAAGVEIGARGLAVDLAPIRVNCVVVGAIKTGMLDHVFQGDSEAEKQWANNTLLKSVGTAEEAAEAYLYSMRCGYVTGAKMVVEGGALLV